MKQLPIAVVAYSVYNQNNLTDETSDIDYQHKNTSFCKKNMVHMPKIDNCFIPSMKMVVS